MKHGADWYKREPLAWLGGVQGLTARQIAVYDVVVELIYAHGGSVKNDPKWFAGWIADMGSAAVRKVISDLVAMGKLTIEPNGDLSQKRAKNEAKTRENLRENARKNGKKGGENSAKSRADTGRNNSLGQATACGETQADKIREDIREETDVSSARRGKRARPKTRIPEDAVISEKQRAAAIDRGLSDAEAEAQFSRFRDWALSKNQTYADWDAAWRNWITSPHFKPIFHQNHLIPLSGGRNAQYSRTSKSDEVHDAWMSAAARFGAP